MINRKGGNVRSKQTLDAEDIVKLYSVLDVGKFVASLPPFAAIALDRVPPSPGSSSTSPPTVRNHQNLPKQWLI